MSDLMIYSVDTDPDGCEDCDRYRFDRYFLREADALKAARAMQKEDHRLHEVAEIAVNTTLNREDLVMALLNGKGWSRGQKTIQQ